MFINCNMCFYDEQTIFLRWFLACITHWPWRWKRHFPKRWLNFNGLHGVMSQDIELISLIEMFSDCTRRTDWENLLRVETYRSIILCLNLYWNGTQTAAKEKALWVYEPHFWIHWYNPAWDLFFAVPDIDPIWPRRSHLQGQRSYVWFSTTERCYLACLLTGLENEGHFACCMVNASLMLLGKEVVAYVSQNSAVIETWKLRSFLFWT
jgi:hypothetical protein